MQVISILRLLLFSSVSVWLYIISHIIFLNIKIFAKSLTPHNVCFIFSTTSVRNTFHSRNNSDRYYHKRT